MKIVKNFPECHDGAGIKLNAAAQVLPETAQPQTGDSVAITGNIEESPLTRAPQIETEEAQACDRKTGIEAVRSFISAAAGAIEDTAVGRFLATSWDVISYDAREIGDLIHNRAETTVGKIQDFCDGYNDHEHADFLTREDIIYIDKGEILQRYYDGYDSSRDIFALYAREGRTDEKYSFQIELANLREGAGHEFLDTYLCLSWKDGHSQKAMPFNLKGDDIRNCDLALRIEPGAESPAESSTGSQSSISRSDVHFDSLYNLVLVNLDKERLRELGWKDGMPLTIQAVTARKHDNEAADTALARTDILDNRELLSHINRWEGKTIYNVMTDRFFDGDTSNDQDADRNNPEGFHGGDWQGVEDKLDYLKDMGVEVLWLSCPYKNQKHFFGKDGYHGYWPVDFKEAEPSFGTVEKLKELVDKAHEKGIKVVMDVVVNHTAYDHAFTTDHQHDDWYHHEGKLGIMAGLPYHAEHQSLDGLPDLRQENREVSDYLVDVHKWWVKQTGVDGFRVDAVRHVPIDFLKRFNEEMRQSDKNFFTLGECFWRSSNFVSRYQRRGIESSFDFPVGLKLRGVFANSNKFPGFFQKIQMLATGDKKVMKEVFTNNRISMKELLRQFNEDSLYDNPGKLGTLVDNHDMDRFMTLSDGNKEQLKSALAFIYAIRGMPTVYYGTEAGMEGPEGPVNRNDMEFGNNPDILEALKKLTAARSSSMSLQYGGQKTLYFDDTCCAIARMRPDEEVICLFNTSDTEKTLELDLKASRARNGDVLKDMLSQYDVMKEEDRINVTVPPGGYRFMQWMKQ